MVCGAAENLQPPSGAMISILSNVNDALMGRSMDSGINEILREYRAEEILG